jgi:hypothetical protein
VINTIFVPQGAEYQAVCRGVRSVATAPIILPIPVGVMPVSRYFQTWQSHVDRRTASTALVMGLCGSLKPSHGVGDVVLYDQVRWLTQPDRLMPGGDRHFIEQIRSCLPERAAGVTALTSDRVIYSAQEKQALAQTYAADVVDMEGAAILQVLSHTDTAVAMVRVVSDDCHHDLPNLDAAISPEGALLPKPMAIAMLRQPLPALRLIRGSLKGLNVLETTARLLVSAGDIG